ncbi:hypothetical protein GCM10027073_33150 [Streptomyces chlorus]
MRVTQFLEARGLLTPDPEFRRDTHQMRLEEELAALPQTIAQELRAWIKVVRGEGTWEHAGRSYRSIFRYFHALKPITQGWGGTPCGGDVGHGCGVLGGGIEVLAGTVHEVVRSHGIPAGEGQGYGEPSAITSARSRVCGSGMSVTRLPGCGVWGVSWVRRTELRRNQCTSGTREFSVSSVNRFHAGGRFAIRVRWGYEGQYRPTGRPSCHWLRDRPVGRGHSGRCLQLAAAV